MNIPDHCRVPMSLIEEHGHEIYIVGGAVRDLLMGITPHDYDAASSALPSEVLAIMEEAGIPCINGNGLKHGTVTTLYGGTPFEITAFRKDGTYSDNRHPDSVEFTSSIEEDVKRRDFTINAMYLDKDGKVKDLVGGEKDLADGLIRAVGDPKRRFTEDALRILRGLRFAARYGMKIEDKTALAMKERAYLLRGISAERIFAELTPIVTSDNASLIISDFSDILFEVILSLKGKDNRFDLFDRIRNRDEACGYAVLFYALSQEEASEAAERLKFPADLAKSVLKALSLRSFVLPSDVRGVKALRAQNGRADIDRLLLIREALSEDTSFVRDTLEMLDEKGVPSSLRDLAIDGGDIMALGIKPGRQVGSILNALFEDVLDEAVANDKESLTARAEYYIEKKEYEENGRTGRDKL